MTELTNERLRKDEIELHYYGFSSTEVYIEYRATVDRKLKLLMVEVMKTYEVMLGSDYDPEATQQMLLDQYKAFWAASEDSLHRLYEDLKRILALPEDFVPKSLRCPQDVLGDSEVRKIKEEIRKLEDEYMSEKYYLHALKQRKEAIEKNCIPLKKQVDMAGKLLKENMRKMEHFDVLNGKRVEKMEKYLEGFDKKSLLEFMWAGQKSEEKEKTNMKNFMNIIANGKKDNV